MKYYTESSASLTPHQLATKLRLLIADAERYLSGIEPAVAHTALDPGKWSIAQTLGHLIDSAQNNLQRIVRLQYVEDLELPGYQQDDWVRIQRYDLVPWEELRHLWLALNAHLAHVVAHTDPAALSHTWSFEGDVLTLGFIIADYIAHMRHHLRQMGLPE